MRQLHKPAEGIMALGNICGAAKTEQLPLEGVVTSGDNQQKPPSPVSGNNWVSANQHRPHGGQAPPVDLMDLTGWGERENMACCIYHLYPRGGSLAHCGCLVKVETMPTDLC